ncbi:hypothetical protein B296_00045196, partial [Ensete ventricosum]
FHAETEIWKCKKKDERITISKIHLTFDRVSTRDVSLLIRYYSKRTSRGASESENKQGR